MISILQSSPVPLLRIELHAERIYHKTVKGVPDFNGSL